MSLSFKIKAPSGDLLTLQVDSDATFLALKNSISTIVNIPPSEMRIVCAGRILKNDDAVLADLGLTDGATLHVVRMAANSVSASSPTSSSVPPPAGVRRSVPGMPDTNEMRRILDNPMMRALFENPSVMAAILESDPRMQAMAEQNPDIRRMIRDPSFLRQISDAVRNPSLMDEMMRNQDRTLSNIESLPGGMAALTSMYNTVERSERAIAPTAPTTTDESNRRFAESIGANLDLQSEGPNENALPNPWAAVPRTQNSGQGISLTMF
ncbi:hypothetical protein HDU82_005216 [Entophlyctis luteolus]|nr:hypothetical protein HDU82_005216 [Entophlyctis luteolus]